MIAGLWRIRTVIEVTHNRTPPKANAERTAKLGVGNNVLDALIAPRTDANDEIELKLLAPAGVLDRLREAPVIVRHARNGGVARRLDAVYYDTPDRTLFRHGLSLRIRRSGNRYVQTIKRAPVHGQPFVRGEWEASVDGAAPDLALLPISEIGSPLDEIASDALDPIFETKVRRRTQRLEFLGAVVEVAYDQGTIEAGERREPLNEVELEVKAGNPRVLFDLGIELLEIAPLRIGTQSKADRGYDLAFDLAPKATRATTPAITAEHTVDDIVAELLGTCQHHLLANQAVAEDGRDHEGVHQMRVALRRLRTASALLRRELGLPTMQGLAAEAKWLATLLGAPRDWDVFVTETLGGPAERLKLDTVDFDGLRRAAEPHRSIAYAALRDALAGPRYNRFQLSLRRWIEVPKLAKRVGRQVACGPAGTGFRICRPGPDAAAPQGHPAGRAFSTAGPRCPPPTQDHPQEAALRHGVLSGDPRQECGAQAVCWMPGAIAGRAGP